MSRAAFPLLQNKLIHGELAERAQSNEYLQPRAFLDVTQYLEFGAIPPELVAMRIADEQQKLEVKPEIPEKEDMVD